WGKVCMVNITSSTYCPGELQGGSSSLATQGDGTLTLYPNPNNGDQLFISLTEVGAEVNTVTVDIYDLTGKRVSARTIQIQDGFVNSAMDAHSIANGLYMVHITAGEKTFTERLVIQK
ncbi:MAG: T9SS type A sorting domain-containing protein, partial [Flavobacteriales bacterium]